jgi:hypothetical protein
MAEDGKAMRDGRGEDGSDARKGATVAEGGEEEEWSWSRSCHIWVVIDETREAKDWEMKIGRRKEGIKNKKKEMMRQQQGKRDGRATCHDWTMQRC